MTLTTILLIILLMTLILQAGVYHAETKRVLYWLEIILVLVLIVLRFT